MDNSNRLVVPAFAISSTPSYDRSSGSVYDPIGRRIDYTYETMATVEDASATITSSKRATLSADIRAEIIYYDYVAYNDANDLVSGYETSVAVDNVINYFGNDVDAEIMYVTANYTLFSANSFRSTIN